MSTAQSCEKFVGNECAELQWEKVSPGAGEIADIEFSLSNPDIVYSDIENNAHSLYKSTDGGITWRRIDGIGDHTVDIAVNPKDPNKTYVVVASNVYTTDLSINPVSKKDYVGPQNTETQVILSSTGSLEVGLRSFSSLEIFENDDSIIYVAVKGGRQGPFSGAYVKPELFKSIDSGVSWKSWELDAEVANVIKIHPTNPEIIYIGGNGIYKSEDSGKTLNKLKETDEIISLQIYSNNPDIVYAASKNQILKSTNGGNSWEDITGQLEDILRVNLARSNAQVLYAATFNGIFKSEDAGLTWMDITKNIPKNIQALAVHPKDENIVFVGTSSLWSSIVRAVGRYVQGLYAHQGIYKTNDGGVTWVKSDTGIEDYNFEELAVNPNKPYEAWYAGVASWGAHKTNDGGQNWRLTQTPTFHYPMRIKFSSQDPDKVYGTGWQQEAPFSYSNNGGIKWTFISEQHFFDGLNSGAYLYKPREGRNGNIHLHGLAVDPTNDQILYVGSVHDSRSAVDFSLEGAHIFKSTDAEIVGLNLIKDFHMKSVQQFMIFK